MNTTKKRITVCLTSEDLKIIEFLKLHLEENLNQIFKRALNDLYLRIEKRNK